MSYGTVGPVCRLCWWVGCKTCQGCMWEILVPWHKCSTTFMTISHLYLMCETWSGKLLETLEMRMPEHSHLLVTPSVHFLTLVLSPVQWVHTPQSCSGLYGKGQTYTVQATSLPGVNNFLGLGFRVFSGFKDPNDVSLTSSL